MSLSVLEIQDSIGNTIIKHVSPKQAGSNNQPLQLEMRMEPFTTEEGEKAKFT